MIGEGDVATPKYVEHGALVGDLRVVRSGLDEKDRVIINGLMRVRPGAKVAPKAGQIASAADASKPETKSE